MSGEKNDTRVFLINRLREHLRQLEKQKEHLRLMISWLDRANSGQLKSRHLGQEISVSFNFFSGSRFEAVVEILREEKDWLTPLEIRNRYEHRTKERIPQSSLRQFLKENEPELFVKDGFKKASRWKIREELV